MKVLHIYNSHRGGGGSDQAWAETNRLSRAGGIDVEEFSRTSRSLSGSLRDKTMAAMSGIYAPNTVREAAETVARVAPDLVHTHELFPLISPFVLRRIAASGVPIVHSCYDYRMTCPVATHFQHGSLCHRCLTGGEHWAVLNNCRDNLAESAAYAVRNAVARRFDLYRRHVSEFIVLTEFSRQWLIEKLGVDAGRITVNHCAVQMPASPADAGAGEYIAYAGRFAAEKGVDVLIEAGRRTGLPVRLAGYDATHPAIRPGDDIACVVTSSREELAAFYRGARMLVVPSVWYETFCIVAAEAMSHGIPVVASRIGALQDVIVDGVTGVFFEPGSVDDLAARMTGLWQSPDLARRLGVAGHARALAEFGPDAHMRRLTSAYERALASTRRPLTAPWGGKG